MKIDVYQSEAKPGLYVSIPAGTDIDTVLPKINDPRLARVKPFNSFDTELRDHPVAMNAGDIVAQIAKNGYAVHGVSAKTTVRTEPL